MRKSDGVSEQLKQEKRAELICGEARTAINVRERYREQLVTAATCVRKALRTLWQAQRAAFAPVLPTGSNASRDQWSIWGPPTDLAEGVVAVVPARNNNCKDEA